MSLLSELMANSQPPATVATPATLTPENFEKSQESQAVPVSQDTTKVRARLLALANADGLHAGLVRCLPESGVAATGEQCAMFEAGEPGSGLELAQQYLRMLATSAMIRERRLPPDFDTPATCRRCGPVWLPRAQAVLLDVVDGWPSASACPWCFIRKDGRPFARPQVRCGGCEHFQSDPENPTGDMAHCGAVRETLRAWPNVRRLCGHYDPNGVA